MSGPGHLKCFLREMEGAHRLASGLPILAARRIASASARGQPEGLNRTTARIRTRRSRRSPRCREIFTSRGLFPHRLREGINQHHGRDVRVGNQTSWLDCYTASPARNDTDATEWNLALLGHESAGFSGAVQAIQLQGFQVEK